MSTPKYHEMYREFPDCLSDGQAHKSKEVKDVVAKRLPIDSVYDSRANSSVKYDLIGKLVGETGSTRKAVVQILISIEKTVFEQFKFHPEEFILKAATLINDEKATAMLLEEVMK